MILRCSCGRFHRFAYWQKANFTLCSPAETLPCCIRFSPRWISSIEILSQKKKLKDVHVQIFLLFILHCINLPELILFRSIREYLNDLANYWSAIRRGLSAFYKLYFIQPSSFRYRNRAIMTIMGYSIVHDRIGEHFVAVLSLLAPFMSREHNRSRYGWDGGYLRINAALYRDSGVERRDLASNWTSRGVDT